MEPLSGAPTTAALGPQAEIAARTDPGRDPDKQVNEDAYGEAVTPFGHLAFVCDGMGGHANGREASELATRTILEWFASAPLGGSPRDVLRGAIEEANRRVYRLATPAHPAAGRNVGAHAGSTCVAVLIHAGGTEVAHVGDSRAMILHQGQLSPLTRDHSRVRQMVDAGLITPEAAEHHPDANQITRALGITPEVEVELRPQPVPHIATDIFILSSDGLTDLVKPPDIVRVINDAIARGGRSALTTAASDLVDLGNTRGGHDNITVVLARPFAAAAAGRMPVAATVTEAMPIRTMPAPPMGSTGTQVGVPLGMMDGGLPQSPPQHNPALAQSYGSMSRVSLPNAPPRSNPRGRAAGRGPSTAIIVVALVAFFGAIAVAGVILYMHLGSRSGQAHGDLDAATLAEGGLPVVPSTNGAAPSPGTGLAGGHHPIELVPTSAPSSSAPSGTPLAPLNAPASSAGSDVPHRRVPHPTPPSTPPTPI